MRWQLPQKQKIAQSFVTLAFTAICFLAANANARQAQLNIGDTAPNWMLSDTQDQPVLLYEITDIKDATVMFFWASWCQKCSELLPKLQQIANSQSDQNIAFYTLNIWEDKDPVEHLASLKIDLPLLAKAESVAQRFGVAGTPSLIIVGHDRKILVNLQAGEINNLEQIFEQLNPSNLAVDNHTSN